MTACKQPCNTSVEPSAPSRVGHSRRPNVFPKMSQAISDLENEAFERFNVGHLQAALESANACLQRGGETARLQNLRGIVLNRLDLLQQSVAAYERALQLDPSLGIARCNLGFALKKAGDVESALRCWQQLIASDPGFTDPYVAVALVHMERHAFSDAERILRRALTANDGSTDVLINLGFVLQLLGRLEEAANYHRAAIAIDPSVPESHVNVGEILHQLGQFGQAHRCFEEAARLAPDLAVAQYNLAQIRLLTGDFEQGWALYESRFAWWKKKRGPTPELPWPSLER